MKKIKNHFKNNWLIYAIALVCIIVISISLFVTHDAEVEENTVDTSMFTVVSLEEAIKLFNQDDPVILIIGLNTCAATIGYVPYLQIAEAKYSYITYYLELSDITEDDIELYNEFVSKLDLEYTFQGETKEFGEFVGNTPMTVIIKNKKQVFGYIGSMNVTSLYNITSLYGVAA